jgi:Xaa-Pro aminopeptidase
MVRYTLAFGLVACMVSGRLEAQAGSPAGVVPVERLVARREALLARIQSGIAILRSAEEQSADPPESDYPQDASFRQDNDFFYLTGLETHGSLIVLAARPGSPGEVHLFLPSRDPEAEQWTGPALGPGTEAAALTGIPVEHIHPSDSAEVFIRTLAAAATRAGYGTIWFRHTARDTEDEFLRTLVLKRPGGSSRDLLPILGGLRLVKDADEIRRLRRAVEVSAAGHLAAMHEAKPGSWEYEIEAAAEAAFRRGGAERLSYPSIVGSGINATILHYDQNRRQTRAGELIVMDMGAEFGYYAADVTRTIPVSGTFTPRQRALYDLVLGAQQAAMDSVRPGTTIGRLTQISRQYMDRNSGDLCGGQPCTRYFIHGLSHWIGMDVHDVGSYATPLAAGMAFTIEPGIYIPQEGIGIRIEDDILVTATGYENLSKGLARTAAEVEQVMRRGS